MESQRRDERHESERQRTEPSNSAAGQDAVNPPFASEGLEQLRDSHC